MRIAPRIRIRQSLETGKQVETRHPTFRAESPEASLRSLQVDHPRVHFAGLHGLRQNVRIDLKLVRDEHARHWHLSLLTITHDVVEVSKGTLPLFF
jgi:hypothetical protein